MTTAVTTTNTLAQQFSARQTSEQAIYSLFFGAKTGEAAQAEKWESVKYMFYILITKGSNKQAFLEPQSARAQQSKFFAALHVAKRSMPAVKGFFAALDICREHIAACNEDEKINEVLQAAQEAFMQAVPVRKAAAPRDAIAAAIKSLTKAREDHTLTEEHIRAILALIDNYQAGDTLVTIKE